MRNKIKSFASSSYWDNRYNTGGNSGAGSYGRLAKYKARTINELSSKYDIPEAIEFGSGDGNQCSQFSFEKYIGIDISHKAVSHCNELFEHRKKWNFFHYSDPIVKTFSSPLVLSLDVIFHLVEDTIFNEYMLNLFNASERLVLIYSSNHDEVSGGPEHVRHRKYTNWILENAREFKLVYSWENPFPFNKNSNPKETSFSEFKLFSCHEGDLLNKVK